MSLTMNEQHVCELINDYIELKKSQNYVLHKSKKQISLHSPHQLIIKQEEIENAVNRGFCLSSFVSHDNEKFSFRISECFHSGELLDIEFLNTGSDEQELINKLRRYLYKEEVDYKKKYRYYQFVSPLQRGPYSRYNATEPLNIYRVQKTLQDIVSL